jgi:hypothetical protein
MAALQGCGKLALVGAWRKWGLQDLIKFSHMVGFAKAGAGW